MPGWADRGALSWQWHIEDFQKLMNEKLAASFKGCPTILRTMNGQSPARSWT
jgi:hypothetical protein